MFIICLDDDGSNINNSGISNTVYATPNISTQNETCTTNKEKVGIRCSLPVR